MKNILKTSSLFCALSAFSVVAPSLQAATIGYWRFEDGAFLTDSSGNGLTLEDPTGNAAQITPLPSTGNGSNFSITGAPSNGLYDKTTSTYLQTGVLDISASGYDALTTFSFETLINISDLASNGFLATMYDGAAGNRSWAIQTVDNGTSGSINILMSPDGSSGFTTATSGLSLSFDTDYYLGVVVDLSSGTQSERSVTFYLQDLTNSTSLQTATVDSISLTTVFAPANTGLGLGSGYDNTPTVAGRIDAYYDSVRYSNTALAPSELLINIPEPSTYVLVAGLACLVGAMLRRRK